jgi:hypothetical protein
MATTAASIPALSSTLMAELEQVARDEKRSVDQVLAEAVGLYLQVHGRQLTPPGRTREDVQHLMEEFRRDRS